MIVNGLAVYSRKGGSGKSTLAAQLAVGACRLGWEVCLVELDSMGLLSQSLGRAAESDHGVALTDAMLGGGVLEVPTWRDERLGLSVVAGGFECDRFLLPLYGGVLDGADLVRAVGALAADHDLVVLDCPSLSLGFRDAVVRAVPSVVVPVDKDQTASVMAYHDLVVALADMSGPVASVLGVAMIGFDARATRRRRRVRQRFEDPPIGARVFDTVIRASTAVAEELRALGVDIWTYADRARAEREGGGNPTLWRYAEVGIRMAAEYEALTGRCWPPI